MIVTYEHYRQPGQSLLSPFPPSSLRHHGALSDTSPSLQERKPSEHPVNVNYLFLEHPLDLPIADKIVMSCRIAYTRPRSTLYLLRMAQQFFSTGMKTE